MSNKSLNDAKAAKNDEFYTQYCDIEAEMEAYIAYNPDVFKGKTIMCPCDDPDISNFVKYFQTIFWPCGIKRLIATCRPTDGSNGKYYIMTREAWGKATVQRGLFAGDGDFRSEEVTRLRDEADVIVTNPPFSLFREFLAWIMDGKKQFIIMGNQNAVIYKEVFPLIKDNVIWYGDSIHSGGIDLRMPDDYKEYSKNVFVKNGHHYVNLSGIRWFTNLKHGRRPQPLELHTAKYNLEHNTRLQKKLAEYSATDYPRYDNYDAIEVPFVDCIPSDYTGIMGVPITFMDKYDPAVFELIGFTYVPEILVDGEKKSLYRRLLIRHKTPEI